MLIVDRKLVIIAGVSGSGKTTLAEMIKARLGHRATVINQDSYYPSFKNVTETEFFNTNLDDPSILDWDLMNAHIEQLLRGNVIDLSIYSYGFPKVEKYVKVPPSDIIIFEGIWMLRDDNINSKAILKIYIHIDDEKQLQRRIERDMKYRKDTREQVVDRYFGSVKPMQEKFIKSTISKADITLDCDFKDEDVDRIIALLSSK